MAAETKPTSAANDTFPVSVRNDPAFYKAVRAQLQAVVNTAGFHTTNRFCIIAYGTGNVGYRLAYIYWPTQNKIIAWPSDAGPILEWGEVSDLTRDILPDGEVTDNYLHRSDVKSILQDCWKYGQTDIIEKTTGGWVPIRKYAQFATINAQLQDFVNHDATQKMNKFCVIGQADGAYLAAYVFWQTGDQLIFWLPDKNDRYDTYALSDSVFQIDLKSGLRNEEDLADQGNEMQRSYAETILKACRLYGQTYVLNKS